MPSVKSAMPKKQASRQTAIGSSEGGAVHPSNMATSSPRSSVSLSQRFSNAAGPSTSFLAANGEFHKERKSVTHETGAVCAAQMDPDGDSHGDPNAVSFDFDKSTGYLPPGDHTSRAGLQSLVPENGTSTTDPLSLDAFLHSVSSERLNRMPHRASKWDRAIRLLEGLAIQISACDIGHGQSVLAVDGTAPQMYAACYGILRMSSREPAFIDLAYPILSEVHRVLSLILRQKALLVQHQRIRQLLDHLMVSVLDVMMETVYCSSDAMSKMQSGRLFRRSVGILHNAKDQLVDELWSCELSSDVIGLKISSEQISAIRHWLWPYDEMVRAMYANFEAARRLHTEFTCEWFSKPLLDYIRSSDKAFWIEGPAGCGKSMLYGWIIESLHNQVGGHDYAILSHIVDPVLPSETVVSCLLQGLLRQAYEQNPGHTRLQIALMKAKDTAATSDYPLEVINALGKAFEVVCEDTPRPTMIVIDGLSELTGGDAFVNEFLKRMHDSISRSPMVRSLFLSRGLVQPPDKDIRRFAIDSSHNHQDIRRVLEKTIPTGSAGQLQRVITWILNRANGNFLWCLSALQCWRSGQDKEIPPQLETLPRSLDAIISMLVSGIDFANPHVHLLLLASAVAARPFSFAEVQGLLSVDMVAKALTRQDLDIRNLVDQGCGSLIVINNDMIQFRHHLIKQAVCQFAERNLGSSQTDIHIDLASRLLLYLKLMETPHVQPTLAPIASGTVQKMLRSNQLLAYALQYWTYHAVHADPADDLKSISSENEVRKIFPDTVFVAALEASYWTSQTPYAALRALRLAAQARREILGDHTATLQSTASLAVQLRSANQLPEATSSFAAAFELSQKSLPEFHSFGAECASECLECLQSIPMSASGRFHATKSIMLLYMRAWHAKQSGSGSEEALDSSHLLARHYAETGQEALCSQTYRDIYKFTVDRYGKSSPQAKAVAGQLVTVLEKSPRQEGQDQFDDIVYENAMDIFAITDSRRIKASIMKAAAFKARNDLTNAELVYLELLHDVTESSQERGIKEGELQLLKIGLLYAEFLAQQGRGEEAQMIVVGLWTRFENHRGIDSTQIELLKDLAVEAQRRGLPTLALTILNSIKDCSVNLSVDLDDSREVEATISQCSRELVSNNESGQILPKSTEEALVRTLESAKLSGASAFTGSSMHMVQTLVDSFSLEQRWHDVVQIASSTLYLVWPAVLGNPCKCEAPDDFVPSMKDVAVELAKAYSEIDQKANAGHIYLHVLRSARRSSDLDSQFVVNVAQAARQTFEEVGRSNDVISVAQELIDHYRATLGDDDSITVEATYELASLCMKHGENKIAKKCYTTIEHHLRRSDYHDQRAIPALKALLVIHCGEKNWVQAEDIYKMLWRTFLEKGKDYSAREETIKSLFQGYSRLLEKHVRVDPEALHQLREEYRTGCANVFGNQALITLEASLGLAKSWEQREHGSPNAIYIYESIIDGQASDGVSLHRDVLGILERVEFTLLEHYQTHSDEDMSRRTLARAIGLQRKQLLKENTRFGCHSPRSLSSLATYVKFLRKETSSESRNAAIQELNRAIESVLRSGCESKASFDAGIILATSFIDCGYVTEGINAAHEIRENIILSEKRDESQHQMENVQTSDRSRLTFSAAFETRIRGSMEDFTNIYSMTLLETRLCEAFQTLVRGSSPLEQVLARGTRLQALLKSHNSSYRGERVEQQMFDRFMESYSVAFTTGIHAARAFFLVLVQRMSEVRTDTVLPHIACIALNEETKRLVALGDFAKVVQIATAGFAFIRFIGGYGNKSYLQYGFQLGLLLGEDSTQLSSDPGSNEKISELGKSVFREVIQLCRTSKFGFDAMDIDELSKVASILGKQQNYHDLEWLLNQLWLSRHNRGSLSQDVIITLGRRLVDVRFFHGHIDSAIDLAEDILYNLRHVYGPSHCWAVEMMNLLSSMYMSKGDRSAAMAVLDAADLGVKLAVNDNQARGGPRPGSPHAAKPVKAKIDYLLKLHQQNGNTESSVQQSATLVDDLSKQLNAPTLTTEKGDLTAHQPPTSWSFANDGV